MRISTDVDLRAAYFSCCRLLDAYRVTRGTCGAVRRPDRLPAAQLHQRGVSLGAVENAFVLTAVRRFIRSAGAAPLGTPRSRAYFSPVIEEVLQPGIISAPPPQTPTCRFGAMAGHPSSKLKFPPTPRASGADDITVAGIDSTARLRCG